jgi:Type II secretion system (T2SS), protein N
MPSRRAWVAIILLFFGLVLWRLPAHWLAGALPANVRCEDASGTVWAGQCAQLAAVGVVLQQVSWQLAPAELLHARIGGRLRIDDARLQADGQWSLGRAGDVQASAASARLTLPNPLVSAVPAGWSGQLQLQIDRAHLQQYRIIELLGRVQLTDLRQRQPPAEMGGYELLFAPGAAHGDVVDGTVRNLDGPLTLTGTLRLRPPGAYEFDGKVAVTAAASEELRRLVEQMGPADAQGQRVVSVAGTL